MKTKDIETFLSHLEEQGWGTLNTSPLHIPYGVCLDLHRDRLKDKKKNRDKRALQTVKRCRNLRQYYDFFFVN